jgi:hypothetical protein
MYDKRFEERKKNFQKGIAYYYKLLTYNNIDSSTPESLLKHRENVQLTLRKEKNFDRIMENRINKYAKSKKIHLKY